MPYTVAVSFDKFLENISITGDHTAKANARRDRIVELLDDGFDILEAFPTGSLVRWTGLKGSADVDVIVALHYGKHIKNKTPRTVLQNVRDQLNDYNAQIVKKNGQAVTLYFKTWPNVDIVPASRVVDGNGKVTHFTIPDMNRGVWINTRPQAHDQNVHKLALADRQRIRMIKTWNQAHSSYLQSYHIEVIATAAPAASETDWPYSVLQYFQYAAAQFWPYYYLGDRIDDYLDSDDIGEVKKRLDSAEQLARQAWHGVFTNDDHKDAIRIYRIIFGDKFPAYG